jgi:hypothetical protein
MYYPFPGPPQPVSPPHGQQQEGVNFVQPSPIQQVQAFEQLNMKNPPNQSNNNKKKGKNKNNTNQGQGGNPQQQNPLAGGNQNNGNQNPQGGNNNGQPCQGKNNNLRTNFPCALCGEYGHYTHHFPQIVDYKWMKETMNTQRPPAPQPPP